jgi:hypothetical protein
LIVVVFLLCGLYSDSGFTYFPVVFKFYLIPFLTFSIVFSILLPYLKLNKWLTQMALSNSNSKILSMAMTVLVLTGIILHIIILKHIPLFRAIASTDDVVIAKIRNNISYLTPLWLNYLSSFILRAILPFFIFYFFITKNKKQFLILSVVGGCYALMLMQKSYIVTIFLPLSVYLAITLQYKKFIMLAVALSLSVSFLVIVANPFLIGRGVQNTSEYIYQPDPFAVQQDENNKAPDNAFLATWYIVRGICERVFLLPGRIISKWFHKIPSELPFAHGCAYNFAAPLLGCTYFDFPAKMYDILYPNYAAKGLHGTVVAPSFMYDYANFGNTGLVLSAIVLSFLIIAVQNIFKSQTKMSFALNFYYIVILISSAISTLLFSGGWGLIILLFMLCSNKISTSN